MHAANEFVNELDVVALSLPGSFDASLPIAAARAGALGILDVCDALSAEQVLPEVDRLARLAGGRRYGVMLPAQLGPIQRAVADGVGDCACVLLTEPMSDRLSDAVSFWRTRAARVGVVVTSVEEGRRAVDTGADLVVAKGHEAGGRVGEETTFILTQRLLAACQCDIAAWGGIGFRTAAACYAAGLSTVVVDWQLALLRESPLVPAMRRRVEQMDGSETVTVGAPDGGSLRFYWQPGMTARERLESIANQTLDGPSDPNHKSQWRTTIAELLVERDASARLWPIGQDAALASHWAKVVPNVARAIALLRDEARTNVAEARKACALAPRGPLASSHGTEFPVVQGPMTRVSDVPEFAHEVARSGGLPFLALALMSGEQTERLLNATSAMMGSQPWGVGVLGFVDRELRAAQFETIEQVCPPFAIIAGGRPDQSASLEARGIVSYLHVPSPGMLSMFLSEGARRFVFEGRECGGHVGPRSSFVLWENMIQVLLDAELSEAEAARVHVLFAGGVHDETSAAMVSALAQPLVERGMKIGVLLGTAYLFTDEIVETGAIQRGFQEEALNTQHTVLLETGPGHATRCADTEFYRTFLAEKTRLRREHVPQEQVREELEHLNLGRLRVASKGILRKNKPAPGESPFEQVDADTQRREGMYMIGQLAALRERTCTIRELHDQVSRGAIERLAQRDVEPRVTVVDEPPAPPPLDIAIVGMSCLLPGANDLATYWDNILHKRDLVDEVPADRFEADLWFDPERGARDKIYSRWGGFLTDVEFDPLKYGIPPAALSSIEPMQLLALELVDQALCDSGYRDENPHKDRTSVILGAGGGIAELGAGYAVRAALPGLVENPDERLWERLPEWTEDSFAGILLNVVAGRISNRFDLGGVNYTVDAACASSLGALYLACRELANGTSDMVVTGGCDTLQSPFTYLCFATAGALSPRGKSRTFDRSSDGIAISEGLVALVLRRREDAERDGDRIYALIRAAAGGSDGRSKGMATPRREGQLRAIQRAYDQARFSPATIGLFEAHGTGTAVGDVTECQSLTDLLTQADARPRSAAIGSVKSMIGHTKCAAGVASVVKSALALHHGVLPPTLHVDEPNEKAGLLDGPLYVNSEVRPWIRGPHPRRAGISSFGFGGTNFHVVLEEYTGQALPNRELAPHRERACELFAFAGNSPAALNQRIRALAEPLREAIAAGHPPALHDLAYTWHRRSSVSQPTGGPKASVVCGDATELLAQLDALSAVVTGTRDNSSLPVGVHYAAEPVAVGRPVAFLFPGQGSQFPNMLRDLAVEFREVASAFERLDAELAGAFDRRPSEYVFPPPEFSDAERRAAAEALKPTDLLQPVLGAADTALVRLLASFGVEPTLAAGHSYGELVALHVAGCFDEATLYRLSFARGRAITGMTRGGGELGTMLAVRASADAVREALADCPDVWLANLNSPRQTIVSATAAGAERATERLSAARLATTPIAVACGFHSPLMAPARDEFAAALEQLDWQPPQIDVYSNTSGEVYPDAPAEMRGLLTEHLVQRVQFATEIQNMHRAADPVFIEVGPGTVLTKLVRDILGDRAQLAVALQPRTESGLRPLLDALAQLLSQGAAVDPERLYAGRKLQELNLTSLGAPQDTAGPNTWLVNGSYIRRATEPRRTAPLRVPLAPAEGASTPAIAAPATTLPTQPLPAKHVAQPATPPATTTPAASPSAATPPGITTSATDQPLDGALAEFQQTMRYFLQSQERVLTAFLTGAPTESQSAESPTPHATPELASSASESVEPAPPVAPAMPVARATEPAPPTVPAGMPEVTEPSAPASSVDFERVLVDVVSERTGYPADMLELDANLEADLGIDSIKRVEIIGAFRRAALPSVEEPPAWFMEEMSGAANLQTILDGVRRLSGSEAPQAPAAASTAADPTSAPAAEPLPAGDLQQMLVDVVSERTGYPPEMLELDANLEADLGIDSIKRVEIIGAFRRAALPGIEEPPAWFMEEMSGAANLQTILDGVSRLTSENQPATTTPQPRDSAHVPEVHGKLGENGAAVASGNGHHDVHVGSNGTQAIATSTRCPRCIVAPLDAPLNIEEGSELPQGIYVITDDGAGTAQALVAELTAVGRRSFVLDASLLATAEGAAAQVAQIRKEYGTVGAVMHLAPLAESPELPTVDEATWRDRFELEVRSVLFTLQALSRELSSAQSGDVAVLCATRGGGDFAPHQNEEAGQPWRGGLAGMMKTAAKEWTGARFRFVDFDKLPEPSRLLDEIRATGPVEVGYREGRRLTLAPLRSELPTLENDAPDEVRLDQNSVVLLTGGARGITACIGKAVAKRTGARMILLGRSPRPDAEQSAWADGITEPAALRAALIDRMRAAGQSPRPREIEDQLSRLLADREIISTLNEMAAAGSTVEYISCDLLDEIALRSVLRDITSRYEKIDAVFHGAGVIEDRYIVDKTAESFDRVVGTKLDGLLTILRLIDSEQLSLLALFSSVAGFFGNAGQVDYACANEILNRITSRLSRLWPAKCVALNWGPWQGAGMVTPEVARQFAERGVDLIDVAEGCAAVLGEMRHRRPGEPCVLLGGGPWLEDADQLAARGVELSVDTPLLTSQQVVAHADGSADAHVALEPARHRYLEDHCIDERPVLPAAFVLELMAELAQAAAPAGWHVTRVEDFRSLSGIIVDGPQREISLRAEPLAQDDNTRSWRVRVFDRDVPTRSFYSAEVHAARLAPELPDAPNLQRIDTAFPLETVDEAYHRWLFHGPSLQAITRFDGLDSSGVDAVFRPGVARDCVGPHADGDWLIDPVVLDAAPQLGMIWSRAVFDTSPLPNRVAKYHRFGPVGDGPLEALFRVDPASNEHGYKADVWLIRGDKVVGLMEGLEGAGSAALNRIARSAT